MLKLKLALEKLYPTGPYANEKLAVAVEHDLDCDATSERYWETTTHLQQLLDTELETWAKQRGLRERTDEDMRIRVQPGAEKPYFKPGKYEVTGSVSTVRNEDGSVRLKWPFKFEDGSILVEYSSLPSPNPRNKATQWLTSLFGRPLKPDEDIDLPDGFPCKVVVRDAVRCDRDGKPILNADGETETISKVIGLLPSKLAGKGARKPQPEPEPEPEPKPEPEPEE